MARLLRVLRPADPWSLDMKNSLARARMHKPPCMIGKAIKTKPKTATGQTSAGPRAQGLHQNDRKKAVQKLREMDPEQALQATIDSLGIVWEQAGLT